MKKIFAEVSMCLSERHERKALKKFIKAFYGEEYDPRNEFMYGGEMDPKKMKIFIFFEEKPPIEIISRIPELGILIKYRMEDVANETQVIPEAKSDTAEEIVSEENKAETAFDETNETQVIPNATEKSFSETQMIASETIDTEKISKSEIETTVEKKPFKKIATRELKRLEMYADSLKNSSVIMEFYEKARTFEEFSELVVKSLDCDEKCKCDLIRIFEIAQKTTETISIEKILEENDIKFYPLKRKKVCDSLKKLGAYTTMVSFIKGMKYLWSQKTLFETNQEKDSYEKQEPATISRTISRKNISASAVKNETAEKHEDQPEVKEEVEPKESSNCFLKSFRMAGVDVNSHEFLEMEKSLIGIDKALPIEEKVKKALEIVGYVHGGNTNLSVKDCVRILKKEISIDELEIAKRITFAAVLSEATKKLGGTQIPIEEFFTDLESLL